MTKLANVIRLMRATTFRYAGVYMLVFAISVGVILGYINYSTASLLERQTDETINAEVRGLAEQYRQGGFRALLRTVETRSVLDDGSIYLFANPLGRRLAGNLRALPTQAIGEEGWIEFPYAVRTPEGIERHRAKAMVSVLDDGFRLIVGKNVEERRQFALIIQQTLLGSMLLLIILGVVGGFVVSRNFLRPIEAVNKTRRAIVAGDLSERIKTRGTGDELDRLAIGLNDMLDQIERLMTSMQEVSSNVAHDLKTPLTRLRIQTEDALRTKSKAAYERALQANLIEADALLQTFDALLSIARTGAGRAGRPLEKIDLTQIVKDTCELYEPMLEETGGSVRFLASGPVIVMGDRQLLAQAVSNLIDNAIKYGADPNSGKVEITMAIEDRDRDIVFSVADRGAGVDPRDRERIKERFVRLEKSRSAAGNGLGLSLVDAIMTLHEGRLEIADNNPGLKALLVLPHLDKPA